MEIAQKMTEHIHKITEQEQRIQAIVGPVIEQHERLNSVLFQYMPPVSPLIKSTDLLSDVFATAEKMYAEPVGMSSALEKLVAPNHDIFGKLVLTANNLINNPMVVQFEAISSTIGNWLRTIDFSPLINLFENIKDYGFEHDYDKLDEVYLNAMFDARWFPYAAWGADYKIVDEIFNVLDTSRKSNNRTKRIDKIIFSYFNKDELMSIKREWRQLNLPSYMIRILIQAVQAYNRKEYALTVSVLSTLWEGIIQEKVNDTEYRVSRRTRENLTNLIKENEFDDIFSSFCEEFIFYNCVKPEEVKDDVPGRHGIAHCWYNTYPNRKVALNAIIIFRFFIRYPAK